MIERKDRFGGLSFRLGGLRGGGGLGRNEGFLHGGAVQNRRRAGGSPPYDWLRGKLGTSGGVRAPRPYGFMGAGGSERTGASAPTEGYMECGGGGPSGTPAPTGGLQVAWWGGPMWASAPTERARGAVCGGTHGASPTMVFFVGQGPRALPVRWRKRIPQSRLCRDSPL